MKKIYNNIITLLTFIIVSSCTSNQEKAAEVHHTEEENTVEFTTAQFKNAGIEFGKIELKNISSTISVNGMLDVPPQNLVSISALMGGFIKSTDLLQGMMVKKGQVIATIQNPDFIKIQSQYLENKQKLKFLELEYKRQEELNKENVSASKIFQQTTSEYYSMQATQGGIEEQLKMLNIDPSTLNQSSIRSIINIYAPISGYVTVVNINLGMYVQPQNIICEIVDTKHLHAELTVFEKDISKIKKDQKIRFVLINESDKERTGSIFLINHKISEERTIRVHAHLDKEDPTLMPNMYLKALIEIDDNKTPALPSQAIVSAGGKEYIFFKTKEAEHKQEGTSEKQEEEFIFKAIEIKKGGSQNGFTEIILPEGIDIANAEIVVNGAYTILSKMNNSEEEGHSH